MNLRSVVIVIATILIASAIFVLAAPSTAYAQAQARGYAINRFEPAERGSDWFVNESLNFRGTPARPAFGLVFDWAYKPLVLHLGGHDTTIITDQIFVHAGAAVMFHDRFRIAADLPIVLFQDGDNAAAPGTFTAARTPDKAALGDVHLSGDVRLLGKYGAPLSAAIGVQVELPSGSRSLYTGDGTVRITPHLLIAGDAEGFLYAAKLGFAYRPWDTTFEGRPLGSEAIFSIAGGVKANDIFSIGPELYGSTVVTRDRAFRARNTPLELLFGGHLTFANHWRTGLAIGPGFTRADGSPTMRVLYTIELVPSVCIDRDGDGICAKQDACPDVDGIRTDDPKTNGCPSDRDHDGFIDKDDACPDERGVRTLDPKTSGCPDRDMDGIADRVDACIDSPGVPTNDPTTNGCPVGDASSDNVKKVVINEQVTFPPEGSETSDDGQVAALTAVAKVMRDHSAIRVRVEGHTDDREARTIGDARAEAVTKWLVDHGGIASDRLRSESYGADRLLDTSGTDEGRTRNRRVEFHVIEEPAP